MDEPRKRNLRWLLGTIAVLVAAGTLGVASALAGGGDFTSPAAPSKAKVTPAAKMPAKKAKLHSGRNCPRDDVGLSSLDV
jgi:nitrous oxide reductase